VFRSAKIALLMFLNTYLTFLRAKAATAFSGS